jgi:hypothetical protein
LSTQDIVLEFTLSQILQKAEKTCFAEIVNSLWKGLWKAFEWVCKYALYRRFSGLPFP